MNNNDTNLKTVMTNKELNELKEFTNNISKLEVNEEYWDIEEEMINNRNIIRKEQSLKMELTEEELNEKFSI